MKRFILFIVGGIALVAALWLAFEEYKLHQQWFVLAGILATIGVTLLVGAFQR